jgi:hypothetical protein
MTPGDLLFALVILSFGAAAVFRMGEQRRHCALRKLAASWQMHFVHVDRLGLGDRVARVFPLPGAADMRVLDICFRTEAGLHKYLFTVEYSVGVLQSKRRDSRAAATTEPVHGNATMGMELLLADPDISIAEQYAALHAQLSDAAA